MYPSCCQSFTWKTKISENRGMNEFLFVLVALSVVVVVREVV